MDPDRKAYEIGLPFIKKASVLHKIDYIESPALPVLDKLLQDVSNLQSIFTSLWPIMVFISFFSVLVQPANEGTFDFAFVDADKNNYWNYHERLIKLVKIGGIVAYDNTLWGGAVALPEMEVSEPKREWRRFTLAFNEAISKDSRLELAFVSIGDGLTICRRIH